MTDQIHFIYLCVLHFKDKIYKQKEYKKTYTFSITPAFRLYLKRNINENALSKNKIG